MTLADLKAAGACRKGLNKFRKVFGSRAKVTRDGLLAFKEHMDWVTWRLFPRHWNAYVKSYEDRVARRWPDDVQEFDANNLADLLGLPRAKEKKRGTKCRRKGR